MNSYVLVVNDDFDLPAKHTPPAGSARNTMVTWSGGIRAWPTPRRGMIRLLSAGARARRDFRSSRWRNTRLLWAGAVRPRRRHSVKLWRWSAPGRARARGDTLSRWSRKRAA